MLKITRNVQNLFEKKKKTFKLQLKPPQNPGQMQRHTMSLNRMTQNPAEISSVKIQRGLYLS